MRIAVDFDGTIVEHKFPDIGKPVPGAFEWMRRWQEHGATLILWTMRSGLYLDAAVEYCTRAGIQFDAVNEGVGDRAWTESPKAYANIYIDDAAFGCPLIESQEMGARKMVDWDVVGPSVLGLLKGV